CRTEERAEDERRRGDGDGHPLAPERRRDLARDQADERVDDRLFVPGLIDEAIGAAGELVQAADQLRIRGVGAGRVEVGAGPAIELDETMDVVVRQRVRILLSACYERVEVGPDGSAVGYEFFDIHD